MQENHTNSLESSSACKVHVHKRTMYIYIYIFQKRNQHFALRSNQIASTVLIRECILLNATNKSAKPMIIEVRCDLYLQLLDAVCRDTQRVLWDWASILSADSIKKYIQQWCGGHKTSLAIFTLCIFFICVCSEHFNW